MTPSSGIRGSTTTTADGTYVLSTGTLSGSAVAEGFVVGLFLVIGSLVVDGLVWFGLEKVSLGGKCQSTKAFMERYNRSAPRIWRFYKMDQTTRREDNSTAAVVACQVFVGAIGRNQCK